MSDSPSTQVEKRKQKSSGSISLQGHVKNGQAEEPFNADFNVVSRSRRLIFGLTTEGLSTVLVIGAEEDFVPGEHELSPGYKPVYAQLVSEEYGANIVSATGKVKFTNVTPVSTRGNYTLVFSQPPLTFNISGEFDLLD